MITNTKVDKWQPSEVKDWLQGLCDDPTWISDEYILNNELTGKDLMLITAVELRGIGATKVDLQEYVLDAVDKLNDYSFNIPRETLQLAILRLACKARSLQKQLVARRQPPSHDSITLTRDLQDRHQRVELDTLTCVSDIVKTVKSITEVISRFPFSKYDDYRSMKSLILALSIELTSTAQRDQFVVKPNDIIERSSKALADYCDRIVQGTKDILLIQPFQVKTIRLIRGPQEAGLGFTIRSLPGCVHVIDKITPLSAAKKTNELAEGDEVIFINQYIVGWTEGNVQRLLESSSGLSVVTLMVRKNPSDT